MKNTSMSRSLSDFDPEIAAAIDHEAQRQHEGLELIASENFVSEAVPRPNCTITGGLAMNNSHAIICLA